MRSIIDDEIELRFKRREIARVRVNLETHYANILNSKSTLFVFLRALRYNINIRNPLIFYY